MDLFKKDRDLTQAPTQVELTVDCSDLRMKASEVNLRLDAFLSKYLTWRSRTSIQALIHDGYVLVDAATPDAPKGKGAPVVETRPGRKLKHGSKVVVVIPEELRVPMLEKSTDELVILYEDEGVLAVEKPANVPVHPSGRHMADTLIQRVHARYGKGYDLERGGAPRLCHRLDRETSGIVLVGKHPEAHADVMKQFERRKVEKEYLTIVAGVPDREGGTIDMPLGPARAGSKVDIKIVVQVDGWPSRTDWRVVSRHRECALVSASPFTGRQHQIRVHLAAIGHPVIGDKIYGPDETLFEKALEGELDARDLATLGMDRHALHNHRLVFRSPATGETVEVVSPLPADMRAYLAARS